MLMSATMPAIESIRKNRVAHPPVARIRCVPRASEQLGADARDMALETVEVEPRMVKPTAK